MSVHIILYNPVKTYMFLNLKDAKYLWNKNSKMLKKEVVEGTRKKKDLPHPCIGKINIVIVAAGSVQSSQ